MGGELPALERVLSASHSHKGRVAARNLAIILLSLTGAVLLSEELYRHLAVPQNVILIYVLAILIISTFTNYMYGIAGTLAAVIIYDYMITAPRLGFSVTVGFPITMLIMLIVSLSTCTLVARIRSIAVEAMAANHRTETVYRLIRNFMNADDRESLARIAGKEAAQQVGRPVFFYLGDPSEEGAQAWSAQGAAPAGGGRPDSSLQRAAAAAFYRTRAADRLDKAGIRCWKLAAGERTLGIMCTILGGAALKEDEEELLSMIAAQMSVVLDKLNIAEERRTAELRAESEQARSSFLRGISHDLRNPLTSILGSVSILLEGEGPAQSDPSVRELLAGIHSETDWLLRMVENILTITRLQAENMRVNKRLEAPEELIAYAVGTIRKRYRGREISVSAPHELVLVPMDPILITQVLINFLENAVKQSPAEREIKVGLAIEAGAVRIEVEDRGPGVDLRSGRDIFRLDPRQGGATEDAARGMGMGLSICKTIVTAHGGEIGAGNNPEGGARFWFTLPLGS